MLISGVFLLCFWFLLGPVKFKRPVFESLALLQWYVRKHVLLCLVPAFFIAGAISVFVSQASVIKYFGARANKFLAYSVASIPGTILAVCSCTVLSLFSGIYKRGASLGPAIAFLYSWPVINVLAIIITACILGWKLGLVGAAGAVIFSIVVGFCMHLIFMKDGKDRHKRGGLFLQEESRMCSLRENALYFISRCNTCFC